MIVVHSETGEGGKTATTRDLLKERFAEGQPVIEENFEDLIDTVALLEEVQAVAQRVAALEAAMQNMALQIESITQEEIAGVFEGETGKE